MKSNRTFPKPVAAGMWSPNKTKRVMPIKWIVIHHTASANIQSALTWLTDPKSERSAHYVVGKLGQVFQLVLEEDAAWHCKGKNQQSLGIEVVSANEPLTLEQEEALAKLVGYLLSAHNLDYRAVTGHKFLAAKPTECPGNLFDAFGLVFNWAKIRFAEDFPDVRTGATEPSRRV